MTETKFTKWYAVSFIYKNRIRVVEILVIKVTEKMVTYSRNKDELDKTIRRPFDSETFYANEDKAKVTERARRYLNLRLKDLQRNFDETNKSMSLLNAKPESKGTKV